MIYIIKIRLLFHYNLYGFNKFLSTFYLCKKVVSHFEKPFLGGIYAKIGLALSKSKHCLLLTLTFLTSALQNAQQGFLLTSLIVQSPQNSCPQVSFTILQWSISSDKQIPHSWNSGLGFSAQSSKLIFGIFLGYLEANWYFMLSKNLQK